MGSMRDDELELRAIEEQFTAEVRAGKQPRISHYLRRYPAHASAIADFAAALLAGEASDVDQHGETNADAETGQTRRAAPSAGTLRALDALFGQSGAECTNERPLGKVAEQRAGYAARAEDEGLEALAQARGVTLAGLAEAVDLPPEVLSLLESGELRAGVPAAVLARLGAALGVGPSRVAAALAARGNQSGGGDPSGFPAPAATSDTFRELVATHPAVTPAQRACWLGLLQTEDA